jgi:predicted unusual protein kinase regulating ubiquinone biosynthesis (AarF/ABC1/UbiB family)
MYDGFLSAQSKKQLHHVFENCEIHDWSYTENVYKDTFNRSIYEDFTITGESKTPIGSGSIGQVYKLWSPKHNKYVAIKVKHPNVDHVATVFVKNITCLLTFCQYFYKIPFALVIKEFLSNVILQLDYKHEADNLCRMRSNFASEKHIVIPEVLESSPRIIIMTYHNGVSFLDITDSALRSRVACDVYMFSTTSLVCHDFVHCDMHFGNWKVDLDTQQIIIYDCGIVGSTGRLETNKNVFLASFENDYKKIAEAVVPNFEKLKEGRMIAQYIDKLSSTPYDNPVDRFADFIKKVFESGISVDSNALRCVQGLMLCMTTMLISTRHLIMILEGRYGVAMEVFLCYTHGLLEKIGKYSELKLKIEEWIRNDPNIESKFTSWLDDTFGHADKDVFIEVLEKHHYPPLN